MGLRDVSKKDFKESYSNTFEEINTGSLQRIADATELMAKNYLNLQSDYKFMSERRAELYKENQKLRRSVSAYRGIFKKRKK